ncbi:MAG TPA: XRE family transcriptional regulator [Longimicrobium sp.]|nr:XRE family transcriptional regulator [Longimicrobium sp.]
MDETYELGWNVGKRILTARVEKGYRMKDVEALTKELDPEDRGVSAAQISRIENRGDLSLREFHLLCLALDLNPAKLIEEPQRAPWEIVRAERYEAALAEVRDSRHRPDRSDNAHAIMYARGVYRYLPLERADHARHEGPLAAALDTLILPGDHQGELRPVMRKHLFECDHADDELVLMGAADHEGEEIVWILEGEAELWLLKRADEMTAALREEYNRRRLQREHFLIRTLRPGDCAHYESAVKHAYRAKEPGTTVRALFVYAAPRHLPVTQQLFRTD